MNINPRFALLTSLLIVVAAPALRAIDPKPATPIPVAIYINTEDKVNAAVSLEKFLTPQNGFRTERLQPTDVRPDKLKDFKVIIVPGGSGHVQAEHLGPEGLDALRNFVKNGGGYVGICAGSYLASTDYPWSLGILNAKVLDRKHWARGKGPVKIKLTDSGKKLLGEISDEELEVRYGQGPLLAPGGKPEPAPYDALATFTTEIAENGAEPGVMLGTTAIARGEFGSGRVICYSPHPETPGNPNYLISKGVRWAGGL
jgi:hypothetical protein